MNTITRNIAAMLCVALFAVPAVEADVICWTANVDRFWDHDGNWDDCGGNPVDNAPGINDTAIIKANALLNCAVRFNTTVGILEVEPAGKLLEVGTLRNNPTLIVDDHAQIDGVVRIINSSTLELAGTATTVVNGVVVFWLRTVPIPPDGVCDGNVTGTLHISDNSTIEGAGGVIFGRKCTATEAPIPGIISTGTGKRLTLKTSQGASKLVVKGHLDIRALLSNDSAHVGTDAPDDVLLLSAKDKDGIGGKWFCWDGEFRVTIGVKVTGANGWDMTLATAGARLFFDPGSDATCMSGVFDVHNGIVDVDTDLCTSGTATVKSVGGSTPKIITRIGNNVNFGGVCSALCGP